MQDEDHDQEEHEGDASRVERENVSPPIEVRWLECSPNVEKNNQKGEREEEEQVL